MSRPKRDYEVGYGKPPKTSQFQPGHSGNPRGRQKGVLTLAAAINAAISERVVIKENGRSRAVSKLEVMVKQIVNKAAGGSLDAFKQVTHMLALYPLGQPETPALDQLQEQDQQLLAGLMDRLQRTARTDITNLLNQEEPNE